MREREIFNLIQTRKSFLLSLVLKIELNFEDFLYVYACFVHIHVFTILFDKILLKEKYVNEY